MARGSPFSIVSWTADGAIVNGVDLSGKPDLVSNGTTWTCTAPVRNLTVFGTRYRIEFVSWDYTGSGGSGYPGWNNKITTNGPVLTIDNAVVDTDHPDQHVVLSIVAHMTAVPLSPGDPDYDEPDEYYTYTVSLARHVTAGGGGTRDAIYNATVSGLGEYREGTTCTLTITPSSGAQIIKVEDTDGNSYTPSGNSVSFQVFANHQMEILCGWASTDLSVDIYTDGVVDSTGGSVSPDPSGTYSSGGGTVQITAVPACGYQAGNGNEYRPGIFSLPQWIPAARENQNPSTMSVVADLQYTLNTNNFSGVDWNQWFASGSHVLEVYFVSEPDTGEILYSPSANGAIIYGANGMPMAQYAN